MKVENVSEGGAEMIGAAAATAPGKPAPTGEVMVKDAKGRVLTLRKPPLLAEFRMTEAAGPKLAGNAAYMAMAMPLIYVTAIDGQPVTVPQSPREVEALVDLVDHAGYAAVMRGIKEHFPETNPDMVWLAKNAEGTPG